MATLELQDLTKRFGKKVAVDCLNLKIDSGEFVVIAGPSGCGKSTMLRMIAGLEKPSAGKILLDDRDITRISAKDRNVSMVFQTNALYPHLSVQRNIEFGLRMRKVQPKEIQNRVDQVAKDFEIEPFLNSSIDKLSGGELRRVAIARAIVREPALFFFDEPLTNLDAELKFRILDLVKNCQVETQTTTVYVTHDLDEARRLDARLIQIENGKICSPVA